jgi:hypothetical protein
MVSIATQNFCKKIRSRGGEVVGDLSEDTAEKTPSNTNPTPLGTCKKQTKGISRSEKPVATPRDLRERRRTKSHRKQ